VTTGVCPSITHKDDSLRCIVGGRGRLSVVDRLAVLSLLHTDPSSRVRDLCRRGHVCFLAQLLPTDELNVLAKRSV